MKSLVAIAAAVSIASILLCSSLAGTALAQQDVNIDPFGASVPNSKHKRGPANIRGCWSGPMTDDNGLTGSVAFRILQSKNKIVTDTGHNNGSRIDIEYDVGGFANGPISGTIKGASLKFTASFGSTCRGNGNATVTSTPKELQGSFNYNGVCPSGLVHLTYEVKPATCPK